MSCFVLWLAIAAEVAAQEPAAMFRGSADHRGVYAGSALTAFAGLQWRVQTGGPVRSTPTVSGGVVFVGSGDGFVYAVQQHSGTVLWRANAAASVSSSPAVSRSLVYVTTRGGELLAVDRGTGRIRWRYRMLRDRPMPWGREGLDYYTSSPVITGDLVIAGGGDGGVYALDAATGTLRWRFMTGGRVRASPAVADSTVYVGSFDGVFYAIARRDGRQRWRHATEGAALNAADFGYDRRSIQSSAAVRDGIVVFGSRDGAIYGLDAATGARRWRVEHEYTSWSIGSPAIDAGVVFEASSDAQFFRALRLADGTQVWKTDAPTHVWSSPAVAGDLVFYGSGNYAEDRPGLLHAVDRATGAVAWTYPTGGPILSSPVVADGVVFVGSDDGGVYAVRGGAQPLLRAVFWDSLAIGLSYVQHHREVRDHLEARGYQRLALTSLVDWLSARIADRAPSVIVFAIDYAPRATISDASDTVLLRRYLDAGGKIVWLGMPPGLWPVNAERRQRVITEMNPERPSRILGVPHAGALFDSFGARVTDEGARLGLSGWWRAGWAIAPAEGMTILATDERNEVVAWSRSYGGPPGTGFVQLGRSSFDAVALRQLSQVAEYRPAAWSP